MAQVVAEGTVFRTSEADSEDYAAGEGRGPVMSEPWVIVEAVAELTYQDSCRSCIVEIANPVGVEEDVFVRIQSWRADRQHVLPQLKGRRVRVTVEIVGEGGGQ